MQGRPGARGERGAAWAVALLVHWCAIWTLLHLPLPSPRLSAPDRIMLLDFARRERALVEPLAVAGPLEVPRWHRAVPADTDGPSAAIALAAPSAPAAPSPSIDWAAEQQRAAATQGPDIWRQIAQRCREAAEWHVFPPNCHRYLAPEPWEPKEKRFGLEGPLPYVRVGRCVVGLGFWGCAVGRPPAPNGHALDGMRDPDRPAATPDNGGFQAPPQPREPLH